MVSWAFSPDDQFDLSMNYNPREFFLSGILFDLVYDIIMASVESFLSDYLKPLEGYPTLGGLPNPWRVTRTLEGYPTRGGLPNPWRVTQPLEGYLTLGGLPSPWRVTRPLESDGD